MTISLVVPTMKLFNDILNVELEEDGLAWEIQEAIKDYLKSKLIDDVPSWQFYNTATLFDPRFRGMHIDKDVDSWVSWLLSNRVIGEIVAGNIKCVNPE